MRLPAGGGPTRWRPSSSYTTALEKRGTRFTKARRRSPPAPRRSALHRRPRAAQEPQPVPVHDRRDVVGPVPASGQQRRNLLEIGDRVEVARRPFAAESAVEVGADRGVPGTARDLTDMIDVGDDILEGDAFVAVAVPPPGLQHPAV